MTEFKRGDKARDGDEGEVEIVGGPLECSHQGEVYWVKAGNGMVYTENASRLTPLPKKQYAPVWVDAERAFAAGYWRGTKTINGSTEDPEYWLVLTDGVPSIEPFND